MAFSRYYQITNQMVAEYTCDQYNITKGNDSTLHPDGWEPDDEELYMYAGQDGLQYCVDSTNWTHTKFPNSSGGEYLYIGAGTMPLATSGDLNTSKYQSDQTYSANYTVRYKIDSSNVSWSCMDIIRHSFDEAGTVQNEPGLRDWGQGNNNDELYFYHDRIRIYLLQGYVMNALEGLSMKVKAHVSTVTYPPQIYKKVDDYITMLDWYMPKTDLRKMSHYLDSPLYMNSKFYDRYIDVYFPSPYACALNQQMVDYVYEDNDGNLWRGQISSNSPVIVQVATVSSDYVNSVSVYGIDDADDAVTLQLDPVREFAVRLDTNSTWLGVRIQENTDNGYIEYYPTYGSGIDAQPLDLDLFLQIESGSIPMDNYGEYESNNDYIDDFLSAYGDQACRWVVINELSLTYRYESVVYAGTYEEQTEYITNTIDYSGKTSSHGDFWRSRIVPAITQQANRKCKNVTLNYTCHLYNRVSGTDIVKAATMRIDEPELKYMRSARIINPTSIMQYKVVNKINKVEMTGGQMTTGVQEKLVRSYYDATNIIVKDVESGQMYTMGKMTLRLKHSSSNYMIRVYTTNSDNVRVPYDLTGIEQYKLVFPSVNGGKVQVYPNMDSESNKLGIGSLVFYITEDKVKEIMSVPSSDRYFALVAEPTADTATESTVYEGLVDYYS